MLMPGNSSFNIFFSFFFFFFQLFISYGIIFCLFFTFTFFYSQNFLNVLFINLNFPTVLNLMRRCYFAILVLSYFRLTKGGVMFFYPKQLLSEDEFLASNDVIFQNVHQSCFKTTTSFVVLFFEHLIGFNCNKYISKIFTVISIPKILNITVKNSGKKDKFGKFKI